MKPIHEKALTFSSVSVPTLKKWAYFLHEMMCLNLGEALPRIQDIFAKFKSGDGIIDPAKLSALYPPYNAAAAFLGLVHQDQSVIPLLRARGASKRRYYLVI
jgi:hypothetical protein